MKTFQLLLLCAALLTLNFCKKNETKIWAEKKAQNSNPLASFNEVKSKQDIINFVESVTNSSSKDYVKPEDRIVCFDNDGTLWAEQPLPSQIYFVFDKVKELAKTNPKYKTQSPYKEVVEDNLAGLLKQEPSKILSMIGEVDSLYHENYNQVVNQWIDEAKHPVLKRNYATTVYQPMLELIAYLKEKQFTIYVVSGGGTQFMRAWQPRLYGIEENKIIGSTFKTQSVQENNSIRVIPTTKFDFMDDHMGKVINIQKIIGKKPIMIVGNSDGDLEMMEYTTTDNPHANFMLYVNHTDAKREFKYDEKTLAGKLEKGKKVALEKGWTIIDMEKDWNTIFPEKK